MKQKATLFFIFLSFLFSITCNGQSSYSPHSEKPKVVIGIVVENMRPDYVHRYWDRFGNDGFKKLYSNGAVCSNVRLLQHIQSYASGTATLFTGTYPAVHGIVDRTWYDRLKKKEMECTEDSRYTTTGADTPAGVASPVKLLSNTVTDVLKISSMGKSKVFSAALNRESALFSAGHAADAAYWFDVESGRMVTSSFYLKPLPEWVFNFNAENYAEMYSYRTWTTLYPEETYTASLRDDYFLERGYFGEFNTFPHSINKYIKRTKDFRPFKTTPSANMMIKDFVLKLFDSEEIGTDEHTDFVTAVFSSMDYENGSFGPPSMEMEDTYLHLDKYLGELISTAEKKYGKEKVLFFLVANTSASYPVDYLKNEFHLPVDNFNMESAIEYYTEQQLYLDHELIKKRGFDLNEIREVTSNFINQFEGVLLSMPSFQLEQGSSENGMLSTLYKSYDKTRSGDFLFLLKEGWLPIYKFKKVNYTDQSQIPLVFYGAGIQHQIIKTKYNGIDLVPTLSELLQIPIPDKCQGNIIKELIK